MDLLLFDQSERREVLVGVSLDQTENRGADLSASDRLTMFGLIRIQVILANLCVIKNVGT